MSDITKLKQYTRKAGVCLRYRKINYESSAEAGYYFKGNKHYIFVNVTQKTTEQDKILLTLHELGHYLDFLNSSKELVLLDNDCWSKENKKKKLTKADRDVLRASEHRASDNMIKLAIDLGLEIDINLVKATAESDRWAADHYAVHGEYPRSVNYKRHIKLALKRIRNEKT